MSARQLTRSCGAVLAVALLLTLAGGRAGTREIPALELRDSSGKRFDLAALRGSVWVASVTGRRCLDACPGALERLSELHDSLPAGIRLVTLVVDAGGEWAWPPRPEPAVGRERWILVQGNPVDAADPRDVVRFIVDGLGFDADRVGALAAGGAGALVVAVDQRGHARRRRALDPSGSAARRPLAAVLGDASFHAALGRHAALAATLAAAAAALLGALCLLGDRVAARIRLGLLLAASVLTIAWLVIAVVSVLGVATAPWRGSSWLRPVYLAVEIALGALIVPVGAAGGRALAGARWLEGGAEIGVGPAPLRAWLAVSVTAALTWLLLAAGFAPG